MCKICTTELFTPKRVESFRSPRTEEFSQMVRSRWKGSLSRSSTSSPTSPSTTSRACSSAKDGSPRPFQRVESQDVSDLDHSAGGRLPAVAQVGHELVQQPASDARGKGRHERVPAAVDRLEELEGGKLQQYFRPRGRAPGAAQREQHGPPGRRRDQRRGPGHAAGGHGHVVELGGVGGRGARAAPRLHEERTHRARPRRIKEEDRLRARHSQPPLPPRCDQGDPAPLCTPSALAAPCFHRGHHSLGLRAPGAHAAVRQLVRYPP